MERLVVGLGNPGPRYVGTRHNAGFDVVSALAQAEGISLDREGFDSVYGSGVIGGRATAVLLPQTFMNESGRAVSAALAAWPGVRPALDLLVVYDDLDLPLGRIRLRPSGGAAGQRGMQSLISELGDEAFARLRFGIGRPLTPEPIREWVLSPFEPTDQRQAESTIERAVEAIQDWLKHGIEWTMDRHNRRNSESLGR
ncbi:aminoacyl-tRNA hydrolase [Myxococcota bacterium]|nr:aminoacyl-tRNA hydrolase [Myxococcota bacterium]